jgi:hypothetical protein
VIRSIPSDYQAPARPPEVRRRSPARPLRPIRPRSALRCRSADLAEPRPQPAPATAQRSDSPGADLPAASATVERDGARHQPTARSPGVAVPGKRPDDALRVLATAVFVAGNARLEPGHRYGLALRSTRLQILGPTDMDPSTVVLDRPVADVEVREVEGRLIVSEPHGRSGLVLAFMSVAGATTADLTSTITDAARAAPDRPDDQLER